MTDKTDFLTTRPSLDEEDEDGVLLSSDLPLLSTPVLVGRPTPINTSTQRQSAGFRSSSPPPLSLSSPAVSLKESSQPRSRSERSDSILSVDPSDDFFLAQQDAALEERKQIRSMNQQTFPQNSQQLEHRRRLTEQYIEDASMEASVFVSGSADSESSSPINTPDSSHSRPVLQWTQIAPSGQSTQRKTDSAILVRNEGELMGSVSPPLREDSNRSSGHRQSFRGNFEPIAESEIYSQSARLRSISNGDSVVAQPTRGNESLTPRIPTRVRRRILNSQPPPMPIVSWNEIPLLLQQNDVLPSVEESPAIALCNILSPILMDESRLSVEAVQAVLTLEEEKNWAASVELPEQAIRSLRKSSSLVQLLTSGMENEAGKIPLLFHLPATFSRAFLRILVRLLTHESDHDYNVVCLYKAKLCTPASDLSSPTLWTDPDHASRRPHLLYGVARLSCCGWPSTAEGTSSRSAVETILRLLELASENRTYHGLIPALARLLGVLCTAGVSPRICRRILTLVKDQPILPLSARLVLTRAMTTAATGAAQQSFLLTKASPAHFFLFHGQPLKRSIKGLTSWPFRNDFGMAAWFRIEEGGESTLLRVQTDEGAGIAVSLVPIGSPDSPAYTIDVAIYDAGNQTPAHRLVVSTCVLLPRLWYHLAVRHTRSRLKGVFSLSTRQQLSIQLDGKSMMNESLPFPRLGNADLDNDFSGSTSSLLAAGLRRNTSNTSRINLYLEVGRGFEGQMGAVYVFKESVSDASFRALYEARGGKDRAIKKSTSLGGGWDARHTDIVRKSRVLDVHLKNDDAEEIVLSQRKSYLNRRRGLQDKNLAVLDFGGGEDLDELEALPTDLVLSAFGSKAFMVWDPRRSWEDFLFELHAGAHLTMEGVQSWTCDGAQDVISSLGGVQALIPLFRSLIAISASTDMSAGDKKEVPLPVLSHLFELMASFIQDHSENARELLRCGGIDIIEQLLVATKKVTCSRPRYTSLFVALSLSASLADQLVNSLLLLRSACSHYVGLETKVFSRLLFNLNLWFGGLPSTCGGALHLRLLPVLGSLAQMNPEKVRDCIGVREMVQTIKETSTFQKTLSSQDGRNRFEMDVLSDEASGEQLGESEWKHVNETLFGMIFEVLASGTTPKELAPLLNYISAGVDHDQLPDGTGQKSIERASYDTVTNACLALLMLLQSRPSAVGLYESFAQCCGSVQGGVAWILSVLVNSKDDTRRAVGIRCVWNYVNATSRGDDMPLSIASTILSQETDSVPAVDSSTVARASSRVASLAKGLASMQGGARIITLSPSKLTPKVVYKLVWHLLRSHRCELGQRTRFALLSCMTNNTEHFPWSTYDGVREAFSVKCNHGNVSGQYITVGKAVAVLDEPSDLVGLSLKHKLTVGTVLRLLRYLEPGTMDIWLSDLIALAQASKKSMSLISSIGDWQPSLFHLISETVEQLSSAALKDKPASAEISQRLDLCLKLYGTLLGQILREGGDKALDAVESAASLQRVRVNGNVVLLLALSSLCADLYDHGTLLEMGSVASNDWKDLDLEHDSLLLKQSAKLVTDAILSNGTKGLDITAAVKSWRSLRHLAEVVVAMVTKSGFGVVDLFDYNKQRASAVDSISGGLHGIRLDDGRVPGVSASNYIDYLVASRLSASSTEENLEEGRKEIDRRLCVPLTAQVLTLLDAFIFPDSLDASLPASQLHGLALVRNSEPRLGRSQGPLVASAIRLSFLLLNALEPCSGKFLQCVSRLRSLIHWSLELVREMAVQEGVLPAFDQRVTHIDRLLLAVVLHCHRTLGRCSALLSEIESSSYEKYFESKDSQKRHYRRLLRVALELREVVSAVYRCRNDVLQCTLSTKAFDDLRESLEGAQGAKASYKESIARDFLASEWVSKYQDVEIKADLSIPEQVTMHTIPLSSNDVATGSQGFAAMEKIAQEGNSIQVDFEKALNTCFETYLESQRKWAETDAVRDLEYEGDSVVKRLSERSSADSNEFVKMNSARRQAADNRWHGVQRKAVQPWVVEKHWKLGRFTDRHGRRILLVQNDAFDPHTDADYEANLDSKSPTKPDNEFNDRKSNLTDLIRRNAEAFVVQEMNSESDTIEDDSLIHDSDGESSTDLESSTDGETSEATSERKRMESVDESEYDDEWDKIDSKEIAHVDAEGDVDGWARAFIWSENESVVARFESVMIVSLQSYVTGKLLLTTHGLYFHQTGEEMSVIAKEPVGGDDSSAENRDRRWRLTRLTEIHGRRYLLRQQAIELFFSDCHELFINFPGGVKDRDRFHAKLRNNCKVPMLWSPKSLNPRVVFRRSRLTELWKKRKISNFQYLMALNRMAGRSFNDITQYPVFPWVLADYTSSEIDLSDSRVYRDLTKPIGALNPDRLAQLLERYKDLELFGFPEAERFLYGSHYSSPGIVLHLLIRQEPFTTMAIELQSGRFDCPDRLFYDVSSSWNGVLTSSSDMKELIPEMFCLPEMFLNTNNFPLGTSQSGRSVDDVGLPPWAKGSAYEFIRIQRNALESDYVSENLSHWIDLIFGYKQRGEEAEAAHNVFHHLSYEGAVDLDKITDEVDRLAAESHIQNFGQTPSQLCALDPHPGRYPVEECWRPLIYDISVPKLLRCYTPSKQFGNSNSEYGNGAVVKILPLSDVLVVVHSDLSIGSYRFSLHHKTQRLRMDRLRPLARRELSVSRTAIKRGSAVPPEKVDGTPYSIHNQCFDLTLGGRAKEELRRNAVLPSGRLISGTELTLGAAEASSMLVSCGYWDDTVKIHGTESLEVLASENGGHRGPIQCLSIASDGLMVTGGRDATVRVWVVNHADMAVALSDGYVQTALGASNDGEQLLSCCHVLWGHDTPLTCVDINSDLDVVVSGSEDGLVCVHTIRRGEFIRSFRPPSIRDSAKASVKRVALDATGILVVHMNDGGLYTYTVNGVELASTNAGELLHDMVICTSGEFLVTGGEGCQVLIRTVSDLTVRAMLDLGRHGPIRCIAMTPDDMNPVSQYLFIGSDDGSVTLVDRDLS